MQKEFQFNEDVGGLVVNLLAAYFIVVFTLCLLYTSDAADE